MHWLKMYKNINFSLIEIIIIIIKTCDWLQRQKKKKINCRVGNRVIFKCIKYNFIFVGNLVDIKKKGMQINLIKLRFKRFCFAFQN